MENTDITKIDIKIKSDLEDHAESLGYANLQEALDDGNLWAVDNGTGYLYKKGD